MSAETKEERVKRARRVVLQVVIGASGSVLSSDLIEEVSRRARIVREDAATVMWQLIDEGVLKYSAQSTVKLVV